MPTLKTDDGVGLHYEEAGAGMPIVFVHEFAGDARSWEPQLRCFSRRYRCRRNARLSALRRAAGRRKVL
jgi:pimeloyl-ACP methyl ester carboxylesterase